MEMAALTLRLLALLALLAGLTAVTRSCASNQYPHTHNGLDICCNYCSAGEYLKEHCTSHNGASKCIKCSSGFYNPANTFTCCDQCIFCNKDKGSIEVTPCTLGKDAECRCTEGSTNLNPRHTACQCQPGKEIRNGKCQPCGPGNFSSLENPKCRPWTNCSARGEAIVRQGSATQDATCSKLQSTTPALEVQSSVTPTTAQAQKIRPAGGVVEPKDSTAIDTRPTSGNSSDVGTITLILISVSLLLTSAGIILAMVVQTKKKKGFNRGQRCRVPVQEAHPSSDSSLDKTCPA